MLKNKHIHPWALPIHTHNICDPPPITQGSVDSGGLDGNVFSAFGTSTFQDLLLELHSEAPAPGPSGIFHGLPASLNVGSSPEPSHSAATEEGNDEYCVRESLWGGVGRVSG